MRPVEEEMAEVPGQDAFLDVLMNIVGIIILLVVVMGMRSSRYALTAGTESVSRIEVPSASPVAEELEDARRVAATTQSDLQHLIGRAVQVRQEVQLREQERAYMNTYVAAAEQELDDRRGQLNEQQQRDLGVRCQLADAQQALDDLSREQIGLLSQASEVEVIENQPTPLAQRSTGKQVYLQLSRGYVAVIPAADLLEEFRTDAQQNLWRLRDQDRITGTVGPISGFRLRYYIRKRQIQIQRGEEFAQRGTVTETYKCEFLPVTNPLGEPVDQAIQPNSELFQQLKTFPPDSTVIAMGVYADSLRELHRLKGALYRAGYQTAEMLVPDGQPVGFSPYGQKVHVQ